MTRLRKLAQRHSAAVGDAPAGRSRFLGRWPLNRRYTISLLLMAALVWALWKSQPAADQDLPPIVRLPQETTVAAAHVAALAEAEWMPGKIARRQDEPLAGGEHIDLAGGNVELRFAEGTTTIVRGPAQLQILGGNKARLELGELSAIVPANERFAIGMPGLALAARAAEFSVRLQADGAVEINLRSGRAELALQSSGESETLIAPRAVRIAPITSAITEIRSQTDASD